ncbi:MAG: ligase-associated DNA damage response endonuclease PdeM [Synechococcaceae cyanobacterium]
MSGEGVGGQGRGGEGALFPWGPERLRLLPQRAVWLEGSRTLLLADLHLGKAETFQAHGIPLPSDGDAGTLNTLLTLAAHWRPAQVLVLGDLIHSRLGLTGELREKLRALPELLGAPLRLVGGNHERGSWIEALPAEPSLALGALWLSHGPEDHPGRLNVCGHRHPVAVVGAGAERLRLPCFAYDPQAERLTLPSFGELTGGHPCEAHEQLWLVAEGQVLAWGEVGRPLSRPRRGPAPRHRG